MTDQSSTHGGDAVFGDQHDARELVARGASAKKPSMSAYTLTHGGRAFIHQHVVDAWAAQNADADSKPIGVFFALVGLYLHIEHSFTGREVQRVHMQLAKRPEAWPLGTLPVARGTITSLDVLASPEGAARDAMIDEWARSVWAAYTESRERVIELLRRRGII